ncbi:hypothetical protein GLUCORHAEAF1_12500 [Komagataeibacter rhaeticus AF1]|uniref:restriction endonuclease subunit S n=1 Tax=Komagataeibacter rhaeticus TaxID=215221 RepID=UPI0004D78DF8|nr:restriction endonuclease subunit S [Komagataeibacter rhaeticus]KDU94685.1 hypothetical protein GLUCORHAEAF1_12500 [Komagataeibacter rhaeticus AF1]
MLPEGWRNTIISEACELINGRGFKPHEWSRKGLPIIRIQNLNGSQEYNFYSGEFDKKILVQDGQLLFAWSGSKGTSFGPHIWNGPNGLLNYHTWKVLPKPSANILFLNQYFRYITSHIENKSHGASALVHTQKGEMENISILLPPLPEQKKIAAILSTWDRAIEGTEKLLANSQQQKKALMQQLLTGKKRLPGFTGEWGTKKLKDISRVYDGTHQTPDYVEIGVPFYRVEHLTSGKFNNTKFVSEEIYQNESKKRKIEKNDILLTRIGDIGTAKLIDWDVRASFYVSLALIKANKIMSPKFFECALNSEAFKRELWHRTIHVAFPKKINLGDIGDCSICFPPFPEQKAIAAVLTTADEDIIALESDLARLRQEKKALMQQLLTGKRRVMVD